MSPDDGERRRGGENEVKERENAKKNKQKSVCRHKTLKKKKNTQREA
jgi:hypothetical protein